MKTLPGLDDELTEKEVSEYLRTHPEFFLANIHLLAELTVPHASGDSISLIERQVAVLRDQNRQLRHELTDLVQIARENDRLTERLQRFTLALMEAESLSDIFFIVHDTLRNDFNADLIAVRLFASPRAPLDDSNVLLTFAFAEHSAVTLAAALAAFNKILEVGKPVCGKLTPAQAHYLFQERAGEVASTALIPLRKSSAADEECFGILAIGSFNAERFHPAMGTLFLNTMGITISRVLMPYLEV